MVEQKVDQSTQPDVCFDQRSAIRDQRSVICDQAAKQPGGSDCGC
jgi:hypothetical protein